jgi:hypothetical protein
MTDLNRRLRRLEQRQTETIIEAKIDAMAKEYGLSRAEILAEAEAVQAYYEKHGHWPLQTCSETSSVFVIRPTAQRYGALAKISQISPDYVVESCHFHNMG